MKSIHVYLLLCLGLILVSFSYYPKYKQGGSEATISWDVSGYYWYLPSLFVYKDLKTLKSSDSIRNQFGCSPDNQQITFLPNGQKVLKYSSGMAFQYLPFFVLANYLAEPLGFAKDGFSLPYQLSVHIGALCTMLFGLWFLRKILLQYFKDATVSWVLFFLTIGTNYLNFATIDLGMSHSWLFSWYCFLMFQSYCFYEKKSIRQSVFIGFSLGVLVLTRPTEMIAILIPLLWGIHSFKFSVLKDRWLFIFSNIKYYLIAASCMILIGSIQLIYWKYATGNWFVYSYGDQKFSWLHPHFKDYIISFRCGWLIYTPIMILPFLGFIFLKKYKAPIVPIFIFSFLYLWIVCAWDIWWYGGRAMIQGYAILMFPFAALIELVNKKKWFKFLFYPILFFFVYLNIWWVHGCHHGGYIYATDMSKAYYSAIFGQFNIDEKDRKFLDVSENYSGDLTKGKTILQQNFEHVLIDSILNLNPDLVIVSNQKKECFIPLDIKKIKGSDWIRATSNIKCIKNNWDVLRMTTMGIRFLNKGICIKEARLFLDRLFYKSLTQTIDLDAKIPKDTFDQAYIFFDQTEYGQGEFLIRDIKALVFQ